MKITKIRFKNINSFYGEHPAIDFTVDPLAATGLFMISGPTGAGKSTLLDVISLALFNQIPRFSAKSLNSKQISANGSVINLIAAEETNSEAYAEVEYEVKGSGYRSRWSISKNRNNNWREYDMEVCRLLNDEIISAKKSDVPVINEGLIGLKYGQFIQSIVLSQGNFAEFLRAKEKERSKLLEDITGSHIYRKLGAAAFQKNKAAKDEIKIAEKQLENIELLSDEVRAELQESITENEAKAKELNTKRASFQLELNAKKQLKDARAGIAATKDKLILWETDYAGFAPQVEKLKLHLAVADLTKPINDLEHLQKALLRDKKLFADNQKEVQQLVNQNKGLIENATELFKQSFSIENFEKEILQIREAVTLLQQQLDSLKSEGSATSTAINREIKATKDEFIKSLKPTDYEQNISELATYEIKLGSTASIQESEVGQLELLNTQFEAVSNWLTTVHEMQQVASEGTQLRANLISEKKKLAVLQQQLISNKKSIEEKQVELRRLEKQQEDERKKVDLEKLRGQLQEEEPCPLCGSTSHPYRQHITNVLGTIDLQIEEQKGRIKLLETTNNEQLSNQKVLNAQIETHTKDLEKLLQKHSTAKQKCSEYATTLNSDSEKKANELEEIKTGIQQKRAAINEYNRQKETLITIRQLKEWSKENFERIEKYKKLDEKKKDLYTGSNIQKDCEHLLSSFGKNQNTADRINSQNEQLNQQISGTEKEASKAEQELITLLKAKAIESVEEAKKQLLSAEEVNLINNKKESLQNQQVKLDTELEGFVKQEQICAAKITSNEPLADLENRVMLLTETYEKLLKEIGTTRNIIDTDNINREKLKSKLSEIDKLRKSARKWDLLNTYIGDANGDRYCNFAQSLTLNNLIGLANQRLRNLSDRYLLSKLTQDFDSLRVVDLYQGNAERSVDTLSGGETFTLSLAMALALSDMASQNVKLDSLFIDEGFGTLDGESLEAAIATLERLQHDTQKTIGIISHRQELMDRVSTQLIVTKGNDGKSTVSVTGF